MSATLISFLWFSAVLIGYGALRSRHASPDEGVLGVLPSASVGIRDWSDVLEERVYNNRYYPFYRKYVRHRMNAAIPSYLQNRLFSRSAGLLQSRLVQAGLDDVISLEEIMSIKVIAFMVGAIAFLLFLVTSSPIFFLLFLFGMYTAFLGTEFVLARKIKKRQQQIQRELPDFLTLLKEVMETGVSIQRGVELMVAKYPSLLSTEFQKAMIEAQGNGGDWQAALENMALRNNVEELSIVISDILLAYRRGTSITEVLGSQAREMREVYATLVDEKARAMSVKLLIPLVVFSFGPMFVLIVAPLLMQFLAAFK